MKAPPRMWFVAELTGDLFVLLVIGAVGIVAWGFFSGFGPRKEWGIGVCLVAAAFCRVVFVRATKHLR
jgi:hypothetical protein